MRAQQHRGADQRAGFVDVHEFELGQVERFAHAGQIDRLSARHAARTGSLRQQAAPFPVDCAASSVSGRFDEDFERQTLQRVADQQGGGLVEFHMHGGLAATQGVVVHGRHVVVHQRIGVDQLDRSGRMLHTLRRRLR